MSTNNVSLGLFIDEYTCPEVTCSELKPENFGDFYKILTPKFGIKYNIWMNCFMIIIVILFGNILMFILF
jgi:hypothetical protein